MNIFVVYFLAEADFRYMPVLNKIAIDTSKNKKADLTSGWYKFTGSLFIKSLLFNMFTP